MDECGMSVYTANLQLLHLETWWIQSIHEILEFPGKDHLNVLLIELLLLSVIIRWRKEYQVNSRISGISGWEDVDKSKSSRKWPNYMQAWAVRIMASYRTKCSTSLQILQGCSHRSYNGCFKPLEFLHLLFGTLWLLPLIFNILQILWEPFFPVVQIISFTVYIYTCITWTVPMNHMEL